MFMTANGANRRAAGRAIRAAACGLGLLMLGGCATAMKLTVGPPPGTPVTTPNTTPVVPLPTTAFVTDSDLSPAFTNQTVLPPTLPPDTAVSDAGAEPVAAAGPRKAIAVAPLTADPAVLAGLGTAANKQDNVADARFVMLVLSPPGADAAAIDRGNVAARQDANAALKALTDAGISADHVDISLATSAAAGAGEIRLYRR
jgi:hypothetical protein